MPAGGPPIDGYVRVSSVRGPTGVSFISPAVQRAQIRGWAKLHGVPIGEVFEELNETGGRSDRPEAAGGDRAGRVGCDQGHRRREARPLRPLADRRPREDRTITEAGGIFVAVQDGLDLSTPTGKLVVRIMLSMAEWELDRIRDSWRIAVTEAVDRGVHPGPWSPFGYRRGPGGRLEPDPQAAPLMTRIFAERAAGATAFSCAALLNESGLTTARGSTRFTSSNVARLFNNRVYLGESRSGDHVNPTAHRPLVDIATWQRAQSPNRNATIAADGLLVGILRCGSCQVKMTRFTKGGRSLRPTYVCPTRNVVGRCPSPSRIFAEEIDPLFEELLFRSIGRPDRRAQSRIAKAEASLEAPNGSSPPTATSRAPPRHWAAGRSPTVSPASTPRSGDVPWSWAAPVPRPRPARTRPTVSRPAGPIFPSRSAAGFSAAISNAPS